VFRFNSIYEYQLEVTTYCNAACPQCPRNIQGSGINPYMPLVHLDRRIVDSTFSTDHCKNLRQIFFCGSYGDPIMHPDFLSILQDFRNKNPTLWLYIHTNGGVHDESYWCEIANIMSGYGQIDFGFDGLEDTLPIYRRNVKYEIAMRNARAFINAGGRAQWNYIVYKHNEHQVEEARILSQKYKFYNFLPRKTGRFYDHKNETSYPNWPVLNKNRETEYVLEAPVGQEWQNPSVQKIQILKKMHGSFHDYLKQTTIKCDALLGNKVVITAEGLVLPCNFFEHNLYDARFHEDQDPGSFDPLGKEKYNKQIINLYEKYGKDNLSIKNKTLDEIFKNNFWDDLILSWTKQSFEEGRLFECAFTCGQAFTKCWDQGGSFR
jgi:MoaA/NifB/PqqE/SkfB family radical SAM enzyme